ncbi:hypothetical protein ACQP0C_26650 [Nocardia sp. CA-129566]|uniref:hypothetical protein n=1 Tax=Nocardia sp. CA-129566 TaxID=3239976 RepID=UPI003D98BF2C
MTFLATHGSVNRTVAVHSAESYRFSRNGIRGVEVSPTFLISCRWRPNTQVDSWSIVTPALPSFIARTQIPARRRPLGAPLCQTAHRIAGGLNALEANGEFQNDVSVSRTMIGVIAIASALSRSASESEIQPSSPTGLSQPSDAR